MIILRRIAPQTVSSNKCYEIAGTLSGTTSSTNQVFYTEYDYVSGSISILYNGQALHSPEDFTETGPNEITFNYITPYMYGPDEVILRANYERKECESSSSGSKKGRQSISNGAEQVSVTFSEAFSSTNYVVATNLVNILDSDPCVFPYITGNKTPSGFTIYFQGEIDSNNYVLEWIAMEL